MEKICCKYSREIYSDFSGKKFTSNLVTFGVVDSEFYQIIVFKGTDNIYELLYDCDLLQTNVGIGLVHNGFYNFLKRNTIEFYKSKLNTSKYIYFSGHSLGAALSSILFKILNLSKSELITFGCPKFGDKKFCNFSSKRIVNGNDIITYLPIEKYFHCPIEKNIGKKILLPNLKDHKIDEYFKNL